LKRLNDKELFSRVRELIKTGLYPLPDRYGYRGSQAPGKVLEGLIGVGDASKDTPDSSSWEIKFHSGATLLTMFHQEALPKGHVDDMVRLFGWPSERTGRDVFRHTIRHGESHLNLYVENLGERITVRHKSIGDIIWPYWPHDKLLKAFDAKMSRFLLVQGSKHTIDGERYVKFEQATVYTEPRLNSFVNLVAAGLVAIDFDVGTYPDGKRHNHGTKFRIAVDDLKRLYKNRERL